MKNLSILVRIGLIFLAIAGLTSCEKKGIESNRIGKAEFAINIDGELNQAKSDQPDSSSVAYQIMISVENLDGEQVFSDTLIPIFSFGPSFVSENLEIESGEYRLTKFMVINVEGKVIYASPMDISPLAYLVNNPLPMYFNILPGQTTRVVPEVLLVGDQPPGQFGYATFGIQVIRPLEFWTMVVIDPGNPLIMAPIQITSAKLTVFAPDGWHCTFKLDPALNHLVIRGGYANYVLLLEKEGFLPQRMQFNAKDLLSAKQENPLILKIPWNSQFNILVLQPGPDRGKDAMISKLEPDKNFGGHKYFEATFLTEPLLTVMRSNRSLIFFNLDSLPKSAVIKKVTLKLSYDLPIPFDSVYYTTNTGPSTGIAWFGGVLQQIVEPWEESKVTWNSQPKTIEAKQVLIPPFIRNVNFIDVDVTQLFVTPIETDPAVYPNYGMLFRLWPVDKFPGFRFASSDYPEPNMRPKLTIFYTR